MKRRWRWILLLYLILMIPASASANSPAPGPSIEFTLKLVHAPNEAYAITILTREPGVSQSVYMSDVHPEHRKMIAGLFSLADEGWFPVTEVPNVGLFQAEGTSKIEWATVTQSMKEYRIILVTESGKVHATNPVFHRDYANEATYDLETNQLTQDINDLDYGRRVLIAVGVTLFVETLLLFPFEFSFKKNLRLVVFTNLATQLLLNVVLFVTHYYEFIQDNWSVLFIMELLIPTIEAIVYAKYMQGRKIGTRILYAFTANFTSFFIGMLIYDATSMMYIVLFVGLCIQFVFYRLFQPAY